MALKRISPVEVDEDGDVVINLNADYDSTDWTKIKRLERLAAEGDKQAQEDLDKYYPDRHDPEPEPRYELEDD